MGTSSGKQPTALITGASRGLGLALARALAERGWSLVIDARGAAALEAARAELVQRTPAPAVTAGAGDQGSSPIGGLGLDLGTARTTVTALAGDVAQAAHRRALAVAARAAGGLAAVVNNASILGPSPQPQLLDYPLETLRAVYEANVLAPLGVIQAVAPYLQPGARVLNISSDAGVQPYPGWGGYGSSKAALEQMSAVLAAENPEWRVYWVDPGDMRTQMQQEAYPGEDISDRPPPEASVPGLLALLEGDPAPPSGRYAAREVVEV
jgi:NAD(P)-dependent dehydrogenase (short-subunit alcohol dehydrogenase family)